MNTFDLLPVSRPTTQLRHRRILAGTLWMKLRNPIDSNSLQFDCARACMCAWVRARMCVFLTDVTHVIKSGTGRPGPPNWTWGGGGGEGGRVLSFSNVVTTRFGRGNYGWEWFTLTSRSGEFEQKDREHSAGGDGEGEEGGREERGVYLLYLSEPGLKINP